MKALVFLLSNILITTYLYLNHFDHQNQYIVPYSQTSCLSATDTAYNICSTCYMKIKGDLNKGFLINQNRHRFLLLKSKSSQDVLTCMDYNQMVDFKSLPNAAIDNMKVIQDIVEEIGGQVNVVNVDKTTIPLQYKAFTILQVFSKTQTSVKPLVQKPNPQHLKIMFSFFAYPLNFVALILIVTLIKKPVYYSKIGNKVIILLSLQFISMQLTALHLISPQLGINMARLLLIGAILFKVQCMDKHFIMAMSCGIAMLYNDLTWLLFLMGVTTMLIVKGSGNKDIQSMRIYLIVNLIFMLPLSSLSYYVFRDISNSTCIFIEICLLILIPLGIVGIIYSNRYSSLGLFNGGDPQRHSISLSGFEEQEQELG